MTLNISSAHSFQRPDVTGPVSCFAAPPPLQDLKRPLQSARTLPDLGAAMHCRKQSSRRQICRSQIGFNLSGTPRKAVDRLASELLQAAASLLLLQGTLQGKVAQAFLKVLQNLRAAHPESLLESYGAFYRELLSSGYSSWQDCLLDEVLAGRGSQIAKQVAVHGCLPQGSAVQNALACDLNALQKLSVAESTLVSWVQEVVSSGLPAAWPSAAAALTPSPRRPFRDDADPAQTSLPDSRTAVAAPPTAVQKQEWREQIGGQWQWSAGLPALEAFWARHGSGLIAAHTSLRYRDGGLEAATLPGGIASASPADQPATGLGQPESEVQTKLLERVRWRDRQHLLLLSPAHDKRAAWLASDGLLAEPALEGVRLVRLPKEEFGNVPQLHASLSQHPRVRFLVLAEVCAEDAASLPARLEPILTELTGWASNVQVIIHCRLIRQAGSMELVALEDFPPHN